VPTPEFFANLAEVNAAQVQLRGLKEHREAYQRAVSQHLASLDERIAFAEKRLNDAMAKHVEECKCLT